MNRRRLIPLAVALAAAGAVAAQGEPSAAAGTKTIAVKDDVFSPKTAVISKNTLVTWRWRDDGMHDVVSRGAKRFRSSEIKTSGTHSHRFKKAGTYRYVCTVHEYKGMVGKITVR